MGKWDIFDLINYDYDKIINILKQAPISEKENIFNEIYDRMSDNYTLINSCLEALPSEIKLKYLNLYNLEINFNYKNIISGINDDDIIYQIIKYISENVRNVYIIVNMLKDVPKKYTLDYFNVIKKKEEEIGNNIIHEYNVEKILNVFPLDGEIYTKEYVLKNILFKDFLYSKENSSLRFNFSSFANILKAFNEKNVKLEDSKMFHIFNYLLDIINKDEMVVQGLDSIVYLFFVSCYDIKIIIKILIDKIKFDDMHITIIVEKLPEEIRKEITAYMLDYYIDNNLDITGFGFFSVLESLNEEECIELFKKYTIENKRFDYTYILRANWGRVPEYNCIFYLNVLIKTLPKEELFSQFSEIHYSIMQQNKLPNYNEKYYLVVEFYAEKYNLNIDNLLKFVQKFGFVTLKYLSYPKIIDYINLDLEKIDLLLKIFDEKNYYYDKSIKNDILNSFIQREFLLKFPEIYNIFSRFEMLVSHGDVGAISNLLVEISQDLSIVSFVNEKGITYEEFLRQIMNGDLELLHQITNKYIMLQREKFVKYRMASIDEELMQDEVISRESYKSDMLENHFYILTKFINEINPNFLNEMQKELVNDKKALNNIIEYKKSRGEYSLELSNKRYLRTFNELLDILYDQKVYFWYYNSKMEGLEYEFVQMKVEPSYIFDILLDTNFKGINNVLDNPELYDTLQKFLGKYKIVGWQETFTKLLIECDILFNESTVAGLLSNFDKIEEKIQKKASLTKILDYGNCYSSVSNIFSHILGDDNYRLIVANEGRNKASMSKYDRLNGILKLIKDMYNRKYITVPPINTEFTLENGKNIGVVLGNVTNMINLTYGERTDSCMRMGGAANSLFEKCIQKDDCFHIRFVNPFDGSYISRVSGIRNGNTLFLNQLRDSVNKDYTNEDLYDVLKKTSQQLVEISKDSEVPIDNIMITSDVALKDYWMEAKNINLSKPELQLALGGVYSDLKTSAIILATSDKNNELVPYNFDCELSKYEVVRDNVKTYYGKNAIKRINQLKLLDKHLKGMNLEEVNIVDEELEISALISGQDFYISISKDGKVEVFVLEKFQNNKKTLEEIELVLKNLNLTNEVEWGMKL